MSNTTYSQIYFNIYKTFTTHCIVFGDQTFFFVIENNTKGIMLSAHISSLARHTIEQ